MNYLKNVGFWLAGAVVVVVTIAVFRKFITPTVTSVNATVGSYLPS